MSVFFAVVGSFLHTTLQRLKKTIETTQSKCNISSRMRCTIIDLLLLQVLLIADECNDVIHVVDVQDDRLTFSRFLAPGCPLLLQPTALNTDHRGRL